VTLDVRGEDNNSANRHAQTGEKIKTERSHSRKVAPFSEQEKVGQLLRRATWEGVGV
jgi:hypothetical protein